MNRKCILILGSSSTIGLELIKEVYNKFDIIIAHYNKSYNELNDLKNELGNKIKMHKANFLDENDVKKFITDIKNKYGCPTHIVHIPSEKIEYNKFKNEHWDKYQHNFDIQVRSIVMILQEYLPIMSKNRYGKVVFVLTSGVLNMPPKYLTSYITVKYALLGLMKSVSSEYAGKNININAISPEMIETKFLENVPDLIIKNNANNNPMKRNAKVKDVINVIKFLLDDNAEYITATNIPVTGGSQA